MVVMVVMMVVMMMMVMVGESRRRRHGNRGSQHKSGQNFLDHAILLFPVV
jgi:heme/copper-type cytochrome/quinol oxidase subunit 2